MELSKSSEPKFASSLKVLQPILAKIVKKYGDKSSVSPATFDAENLTTGSMDDGGFGEFGSSSIVRANAYNSNL